MGFLEPTHLIFIALVVLLLFGPKKIPELMRGLGKGMGELQKGINEGKEALHSAMTEIQHEAPEPPTPDKVTSAAPGTEPQAAPVESHPAPQPSAKTEDHPVKSA